MTWNSTQRLLEEDCSGLFNVSKRQQNFASTVDHYPSLWSNYSIAGLGVAITSGSANHTQAQLALSHIPSLKLGPGYRDSSKVLSSDSSAILSPNTNGFLLSALLTQRQTGLAAFLLKNLWGAMIANTSSTSAASWEYVNQHSEPGYGQYTSLSHPWGGAATYALTNYVAGIRPASFGYKTWVVEPAYVGFGLEQVDAKVTTPHGPLSVAWAVRGSVVNMTIDSPPETTGKLVLSKAWACTEGYLSHGCETAGDFVREIEGGRTEACTHLIQL
ncbi:bacterial alpha-L-rhamnosidase-domain-containing protein [Aspergillus bertholletiae]|uniref:Bacterial alpha-L-rhamnosidase-domain-containing protein n=1 Tax=Aspergillus bertholletiae TaxID=1226010 RepID=A0A5N7AVJ5_9EURO|nr:bacterial alpha-L-rhamnosidase-domain-containing protein [Aspergillus bertholletiae]